MSHTVVSIMPIQISGDKPGLIPCKFTLDPCINLENDGPSICVIENIMMRLYIKDWETILVPEPTDVIAGSVVNDYIRSQWAYDEDAKPGLFFVEGKLTPDEVVEVHSKKLKRAVEDQMRWFNRLVRLGDEIWKVHKAYNAVSEMQRIACRELKLRRPWIEEIKPGDQKDCPFCYSVVHGLASVCPNCKQVIDSEFYRAQLEKLGLQVPA